MIDKKLVLICLDINKHYDATQIAKELATIHNETVYIRRDNSMNKWCILVPEYLYNEINSYENELDDEDEDKEDGYGDYNWGEENQLKPFYPDSDDDFEHELFPDEENIFYKDEVDD